MKVVVNATPLIALASINQLKLLQQLFDEVIVPNAVYQEVVIGGAKRTGAVELKQADWIQIQAVTVNSPLDSLLLGLDAGELEVILLGLAIKPDWVIIDERLGRRVAQGVGLPVKGTVGILLAGFYAGYLSKSEIEDSVQQLVNSGIRLSPQLINWIEREVNQF